MMVPAVCDNCGNIFPSGFSASNATNISFSNCRAGPCPVCGSTGHIPDGIYNFIGDTIELLSGPQRSVVELKKLASILERARDNNANPQTVGKEIDESVPELSSLKDWLPKTRSELYPFIIMLLAVVTLITNQIQSGKPSNVEINTVINNVYHQTPVAQNSTPVAQNSLSSITKINTERKIGRNELCICGSGKKYKKCCLH